MKRKILSAVLTFSILCSIMPSVSAQKNVSDKDLDSIRVEMTEEANVEGQDLGQLSVSYDFDPEATQEPVSNEPIIHEEIIESYPGFPEEEYIQESVSEEEASVNASEGDIETFAVSEDNVSIWKQLCAESYGADYLTPYKRNSKSQSVTGSKNRLVVKQTDLSIPGKNGLDVNIMREHDNQGYRYTYTGAKGALDEYSSYRYGYGFANSVTGYQIYVLFMTRDDFYTFAKNGFTISSYTGSIDTKSYNGKTINCYLFEDIYEEDSSGNVHLEYDSSMPEYVYTYKDETTLHLSVQRLSDTKNYMGGGWHFLMPEVYLYQSGNENESGSTNSYYRNEYLGTFRAISGEVYSLHGHDQVTKTKVSGKPETYKYTSTFYSDSSDYLKYESFYTPQMIQTTENVSITYNFVVYDSCGRTYYFYNTGIGSGTNVQGNHAVSIVAVADRYNNMIRYEYEDEEYTRLSKIIDTYGREININRHNNSVSISYNDAGISRNIVYNWEELASSVLNNDSPIKDKNVLRFTFTNEEGEKTIYDERETQTAVFYKNRSIDINANPKVDINTEIDTSLGYNIERILYPTGSESRYKYKRIYDSYSAPNVVRGLYAVESSYDVIDGVQSNSKMYSFSNTSLETKITENNSSSGLVTVNKYNSKGLLKSSVSSENGGKTSPYKAVNNSYNDNNKLTSQTVDNDGIEHKTQYTYSNVNNYDGPETVKTDNMLIEYTYHIIDEKQTNIPKKINYKYKSDNKFVLDYSVENTINTAGSIIETKQIQDSNIKSQEKYIYDDYGRVISELNWIGSSNSDNVLDENDRYVKINATYTENPNGNMSVALTVTGVVDPDGNSTEDISETYSYNVYGYPVEKIDGNGESSYIQYDGLSRPVKYTYPNGAVRTNVYNTTGKLTEVTDELGNKSQYVYDGFGKLKEKKFNQNGTWCVTEKMYYDAAERLASDYKYCDGSAYTKEDYIYDILSRVNGKIVSSNNLSRLYTEVYNYSKIYDGGYKSIISKSVTSSDGIKAAEQKSYYDNLGREVKNETSDGSTTMTNEYTYDYRGNVLTSKDAKGNVTEYQYDINNRVTSEVAPDGHIKMYAYDMLGRAAITYDSANNGFTYNTFDTLNRIIKTRSPFGIKRSEKRNYYDANSNLVKEMIQDNEDNSGVEQTFKTTLYTYDNMNNLRGATVENGSSNEAVGYWYDNANRLVAMASGLSSISLTQSIPTSGAVTRYEYDRLGNLAKETDALGNSSEYYYDYLGNVISGEDRNGNCFDSTFGPYGMTYSDTRGNSGEIEDYITYDKLGRVTQKKTDNGDSEDIINYTYDAFGRVLTETNGSYVNSYQYDLNSNVVLYTLKENGTVKSTESYEYDEANHLTKQTANGKIISYKYDSGLLYQKDMDGVITDIDYNNAGLPKTYTTKYGNNVYSSYTYSYSLDGNRIGETDSVNNITRAYTYDKAGRLTKEDLSGAINKNTVYTYDKRGNRTKETVTGDESYVMTNTYDLNNRLTKQTKSNGSGAEEGYQYYYDNNGNQTFKQRFGYSTGTMMSANLSSYSNDIESFTYNARNQLTGYTKGSTTASYTYGANGLRKSKTVGSTVTGFIWNGQNLAAETNGSAVKNIYSYGADGIQCGKINGSDILYVKDAHGNTVTTLNSSKGSIRDYTYDAFGNQLSTASSSDTNPFRYCGEYYDKESGNIYLRARYYDSSIGRFISEDPIKDGLNWYSYCSSNPVLLVDPNGMDDYIFYGDDQKDYALKYAENLQNDGKVVHLIYVEKADDFYNGWSNMGSNGKTIDTVYIQVHGKPDHVLSSKGSEEKKKIFADGLERKTIDTILLTACDTGNMDYKDNFATQLLNGQNVSRIIAPDGLGKLETQNWAASYYFDDKNIGREGNGMIMYENIDGKTHITTKLAEDRSAIKLTNLLAKGRLYSSLNSGHPLLMEDYPVIEANQLLEKIAGL